MSSEDPNSDNNNRDRDTVTLLHDSSTDIENGHTYTAESRVSLDDSTDDVIMVELMDEHANPLDDPELEEIAKDTSTLAQWLQRGYVNLKSRTKKNLKRASFHEGTKLEMSPSGLYVIHNRFILTNTFFEPISDFKIFNDFVDYKFIRFTSIYECITTFFII